MTPSFMVADSDVLKILRIDIYLKGADAQAIEINVYRFQKHFIIHSGLST